MDDNADLKADNSREAEVQMIITFDDFNDLFIRIREDSFIFFKVFENLKDDFSNCRIFEDNMSLSKFFLKNNDSTEIRLNDESLDTNIVNNQNSFEILNKNKKNRKINKTRYLSIKFKKKYGIDLHPKNNPINQSGQGVSNSTTLLDNEINWGKNNDFIFRVTHNSKENHLLNNRKSDLKTENSTKKYLKIKLDKNRTEINNNEEEISNFNPDALNDPIHIKDCILGLNSQYPERVYKTLKSLPDIIATQPFDLDFSLENLSELLLKFSNDIVEERYRKIEPEFNLENLIETALAQLTVFNPIKMTQILCKRFFIEDSGIKQKMDILNVIMKSCQFLNKEQILDLNKLDFREKDKNKIKKLVKIPEENPNYYTSNKKTKNIKKLNNLFPFIEYIVFPLLRYLEKKNVDFLLKIKEMDFLLAKFLLLIAKIIYFSENYPKIYQVLFESFELFKCISKLKENSLAVVDSLNFYVFVLGKFINQNFIDIYPEYLKNFKYCLEFLKGMLDEVENEEIKIEIVKNLNFYIVKLKKLRHDSLLSMEGIDLF